MGAPSFASGLVAVDQNAKRHLEFGRYLVEHHRVSDELDTITSWDAPPSRCLHCRLPLLAEESVLCTVCERARDAGAR